MFKMQMAAFRDTNYNDAAAVLLLLAPFIKEAVQEDLPDSSSCQLGRVVDSLIHHYMILSERGDFYESLYFIAGTACIPVNHATFSWRSDWRSDCPQK